MVARTQQQSTLINAGSLERRSRSFARKVQTTRFVRGIALEGKAQIVFVDTPGIFAPKRRSIGHGGGRCSTGDADAPRCWSMSMEASMPRSRPFSAACRKLPPKGLVLNKIDTVEPPNFSNSPPVQWRVSLRKHS
jgi:GTP-binding protein Era